MKVHLRERYSKKEDRIYFHIEVYRGYTKTDQGKIKHNREFKKLEGLYLYAKPKTSLEKQHNKEHKLRAERRRNEVENQILDGIYEYKSKTKTTLNFIAYFKALAETKITKDSNKNYLLWLSAIKHFEVFANGRDLQLKDISSKVVEAFKHYLLNKAKTKSNTPLAKNTSTSYFNKFRATINKALSEGLIVKNPLATVSSIKAETPLREYLTLEELQKVSKQPCKYKVMKEAFIFSCLTGLRWSDINKLTWSEVRDEDQEVKIIFKHKKTKEIDYLPISKQARALLGERQEEEERVFKGLKYSAYHNVELQRWMLSAGITKRITFHCARHTFATLQLTLGTDIYTLSKLLGHSEVKTTQIYAKVIDKKKEEAVNRIPNINL